MLHTMKSNKNKPPRVLIYGSEGCGKSTFGAKSESPIFISQEGGADQLEVDELQGINSWDTLKKGLNDLIIQPHDFKTLVIDSADWVEKLAHQHIIGTSGKDIVRANGGYGAGYRDSERMHKELIDQISQVREKRNMAIIVTAHAHVKPVKDPSMMQDYDSFEIKCHELVSSLWREWVDALLFVRFRTFVKESESTKARALSDGSRVMYTRKQPSFQAKNRYGLPEEMDFTLNSWNEFISFARSGQESINTIVKDIVGMMSLITDETLLKKVNESVANEKTVEGMIKIRTRLEQITNQKGV